MNAPKNDGELLTMLRSGLDAATMRDGDTVPVYLTNKYFKREMMEAAIKALEQYGMERTLDAGRRLNGLERLGMCVLLDAANVELPEKVALPD